MDMNVNQPSRMHGAVESMSTQSYAVIKDGQYVLLSSTLYNILVGARQCLNTCMQLPSVVIKKLKHTYRFHTIMANNNSN